MFGENPLCVNVTDVVSVGIKIAVVFLRKGTGFREGFLDALVELCFDRAAEDIVDEIANILQLEGMFAEVRVDSERREQFSLGTVVRLFLGKSRCHEFFYTARNEFAERDGVLDNFGCLRAVGAGN